MNQVTKDLKQLILQTNPIFAPLEPPILNTIIEQGEITVLEPGELIIAEEQSARKEFYVVMKGELEAFKIDKMQRCYSLNRIQIGDIFGESIILGEKRRTTSVRAIIPSEVLTIPNELIEQYSARYPISVTEFGKNLHKQTIAYLNKINEKATDLINTQKNINFFLVNIVVFLSLFAIFVPYIESVIKVVYPTLITTPLVFIGSILVLLRLRSLNLPFSVVGITTKNLKKSIFEAVVISFSILLILLFLKYCLIHFTQTYASTPLFLPAYARYELQKGEPMGFWMFVSTLLLYVIHAIFQEIIARGSLQGIFSQVFPPHKKFYAIGLASLVFASAHAYFGLIAVMVVFLPGLFWGWLYYKQQNIFGAIVSHIIIGIGALSVIGWATIPT